MKASTIWSGSSLRWGNLLTLEEAEQIEFCTFPNGYTAARDRGDCVFDAQAALRACRMGPQYFRHSRGSLGGKPLELQPWQCNIIGTLWGWKRPDGLRRYRSCYIEVGRGNGKALALDTPIPTPTGWTTMGDIEVGDTVFDERGIPCRVTGATHVMLDRPCRRVVFSDGTSIVADDQHEWLTTAKNSGQPRANRKRVYANDGSYSVPFVDDLGRTGGQLAIRTTAEISSSLLASSRPCNIEQNHAVSVCSPLSLPQSNLTISPYVLGSWLGDGSSADSRFTCAFSDCQIIEEIRQEGTTAEECNSGSTDTTGLFILGSSGSRSNAGQSLRKSLRQSGLLNNKHIPQQYLRSSESQRLALLQGLMDTDGTVAKAQRQCEFTSTRQELADGMVELARSLGLKPTKKIGRATIYGKDCGPKYRVTFTPPSGFKAFRLARKQAVLDTLPASSASGIRKIISADRVESVPVRCIEVDSESHLYLAGESMIPTHNSTMVAIIAGLLMYLDDEPGAEIIGAAGSRDQAREVFNVFKMSVASSPALNRVSKIYQNSVTRIDSRTGLDRAVYKVASAEAGTAHGGSAYGIIFDELHVQPNRDLWDVLESSKLKRDQPLTVAITTAGHDRQSICWEQHEYAENVASGSVQDNSFLPVIYAASVHDDWTDPVTWFKANPNLGVSIKVADMAAACEKAKTSPGYTNTFKRLHLDLWTELATLAIPMEQWDRCHRLVGETPAEWRERKLIELEGESCYAGLDLSSKIDITALCLWFPDHRIVLPWFWVPAAAASRRAAEPGNRGRYEEWIANGFMLQCPGVRIDQRMIRDKINEVRERFTLLGLSYDKWNAEALRIELEGDGHNVIEFGQTLANFTEPTKELIASVADQSIEHGHNPILRWMASNLSVYTDPNENIRPDKKHSADKIDGMVAWLMAWGEAISQSGDSSQSYYDRDDAFLEVF